MKPKKSKEPIILDAYWCADGVYRVSDQPDIDQQAEVTWWRNAAPFPGWEKYVSVDPAKLVEEAFRDDFQNYEEKLLKQFREEVAARLG